MRIITNFFFLLLSVSVVACKNAPKDSVNEVSLKGLEVQIPSENIEKNPKLIINDLLISQRYTRYISSITPNKCSGLDTLFCLGNGHHEFHVPTIAKGIDKSLMIIDQPSIGDKLTSLTIISETDSVKSIKDKSKWKKYDLLNLPPFRLGSISFASLNNTSILVAGTPLDNLKHIFSVIDYKRQKVTPLKYWPDDGVKDCDMAKHAIYADNCRIYANNRGCYLYQCEWSKFAFIFTIDGEKINVVKQLFSEYPDYSSDESGLNFVIEREQLKFETLDCITSSNNIYFLLKDSDRNGNKFTRWTSPYIYGNTVVEYDWDGNKKRIIHLDHYGQNILLSEDNRTLYLSTCDYLDNPEPKIWSYDLSTLK